MTLVQQSDAVSASTSVEHNWEAGRVVQLSDGDTPYVNIWGDGTGTKQPVRLIDVQATETTHNLGGHSSGRNWCHGPAATRRLQQLEPVGSYVHLASKFQRSANGGRRLRTVWAYQHKSRRWVNVQRAMIKGGQVIWFPMNPEDVHNLDYHRLADYAALHGWNVWNKSYCGYGPEQSAHLRVYVHWDANSGDDTSNANRNDEYVIVHNEGGAGWVNLSGWYVRESGPKVFRFPGHTWLAPGAELRVHTGYGSRHGQDFYWDLSGSIFDQVATSSYGKSAGMGDGAFLLDPQGDFRAWNTYPCVLYCSDPSQSSLSISRVGPRSGAHTNREYIDVHNYASHRVSLGHLQLRSWPYNYVFPYWWVLKAHDTVRVNIRAYHRANTAHNLYWTPAPYPILSDANNEVDLSTLRDVRIGRCVHWGHGPTAQCNW